jgi:putative redox protein
MYAMRKEMDVQEILVDIKSVPSEDKVYTLVRKIDIIGNVDDEQRAMLHRISEKCFVHKVLMNEVRIDTEIR